MALILNGTNQNLDAPVSFGVQPMFFMAWVRSSNRFTTATYVSAGNNAVDENFNNLQANDAWTRAVNFDSYTAATAGPCPDQTNYHCYMAAFESGYLTAYFDGTAGTPVAWTPPSFTCNELNIGNTASASYDDYTAGAIEHVAIWTGTIPTVAERAQLYARTVYPGSVQTATLRCYKPLVNSLTDAVGSYTWTARNLASPTYESSGITYPAAPASTATLSGQISSSVTGTITASSITTANLNGIISPSVVGQITGIQTTALMSGITSSATVGQVRATNQTTTIIIDHNSIAEFDTLTEAQIAAAKKILVCALGESHGRAYHYGPALVQAQDARFTTQAVWMGAPEAYREDRLRTARTIRFNGAWLDDFGEEDVYTNATARGYLESGVGYMAANYAGKMGVLFGHCWDMTWITRGTNVDSEFGCVWFGTSVDGPQGDREWGLNAADQALTGNSVCMDTYLDAIATYDSVDPDIRAIFTTGPVDSNINDEGFTLAGVNSEGAYQRSIKNQYIRDYVDAHEGTILFDYADILSWNSGAYTMNTWDGHTFVNGNPLLASGSDGNDYVGAYGTDHISEEGTLRIGKAMWVLAAKLAEEATPAALSGIISTATTGTITASAYQTANLNGQISQGVTGQITASAIAYLSGQISNPVTGQIAATNYQTANLSGIISSSVVGQIQAIGVAQLSGQISSATVGQILATEQGTAVLSGQISSSVVGQMAVQGTASLAGIVSSATVGEILAADYATAVLSGQVCYTVVGLITASDMPVCQPSGQISASVTGYLRAFNTGISSTPRISISGKTTATLWSGE